MKYRASAVKHAQMLHVNNYSLNITNNNGWLILVACAIAILAVFFWGIFGEINTQVIGKGIILVNNGKIYNVVSPIDLCKVKEIKPTMGMFVKKGEPLVQLENSELTTQIAVSENHIKKLNTEFEKLQEQRTTDISDLEKILAQKDIIFNKIISIEATSVGFLEDLAVKQDEMLKKGLANRIDYSRPLVDLTNSKASLQNSYNQLLEEKILLNNKKVSWLEKSRELQLTIQNEEFKINSLKEKYATSKQLDSPVDGIVIGIQATLGEIVNSGQSIINIATTGEGLDTIAYFSPEKGKKVEKGMKALVSPLNIKPEEYGNLIGEVIAVAEFPTNNKEMMSTLKNENLVKYLAQDQAPIIVHIRIQEDKNTFSGFRWSSSKGPEEKITPGTLSEVKVIVKRQRPITLLIPAVKKLFM